MSGRNRAGLFPLIRLLSRRVSPLLIRLPVSANQVTLVSLVAGLAACWFFFQGGWENGMTGALIFVFSYVLDNVDGEVARAKNQASAFGRNLDTFADWVVNAAFFAALGWGVSATTGQAFWFWLGSVGAAGATINYFLGLYLDRREASVPDGTPDDAEGAERPQPEGWLQWSSFVLRELSRADFCFIVLALALADVLWILLPTAALGAHAYWMAQFVRGARSFRV